MILFSGDKELYDFISGIYPEVSIELPIDAAEKVIVSEYSHSAVSLVRAADEMSVPVLGILDGYRAVAEAFGADCVPDDNCPEGKQEFAVVDVNSPIYKGLGHVISVCRGNPITLDEERIPPEIDCIARAETGEVISFCKKNSLNPKIFAVNYYLNSTLTGNGEAILKNFLSL